MGKENGKMGTVITEAKAMEIVNEFLDEIRHEDNGVLALYLIGSLGGGYYRPGQSDIDTVIVVRSCLVTCKVGRKVIE